MIPVQPTLALRATALFASPLQESQCPRPGAVRVAVAEVLARHERAYLDEIVAGEAGDHPDLYLRRMEWARRTVRDAFQRPPAPLGRGGQASRAKIAGQTFPRLAA